MKRLLVLLLALCLPMTAFADTVAERVGAPERWQGEFATATGRTHVYVDMTIEVPEVEAIPLWEVKPHTFTVEEISRFADIMLGEGNWHQEEYGVDSVEGEPCYLTSEYAGDAGICYSCYLYNDERHAVYGDYDILKAMPDWHITPHLDFATPFEENWGRDICTEEEAVAMADALVAQIAPGLTLDGINPEKDGRYMSGRIDDRVHFEYGHRLHYERTVSGIRVTPVHQQGARDAQEQLNPVLAYEKLTMDIGEKGIFSFRWENPIEITDMIAEDCELLSFDQVMDIFGTIAPLSIQNTEYEANNALYVDRAVLGYMCLQERDKPMSYRLVPVWDFFGERTIGRERYGKRNGYSSYDWSLLTINAIDGTIIDRDLGY